MTVAGEPGRDPVLPDADLDEARLRFALRIRAFAHDMLAPHARRIDEDGGFRRECVGELAAAGILGGPIAARHGGAAWTATELAIAHEEIGAVCGNTRGFLAVHTGLVSQCLERHGDDAQRAHWLGRLVRGDAIGCFALTEDDAGSDVAALQTRALPTDGGHRLTGRKIWITNGGVADVALVFANADPARGKDGITAFLVDTTAHGLRRERMPGRELGHRGSDHAQLVFEDVFVPSAAVVGGVGNGFAVALDGLHAGRLSVAAGAVGIHRAALAATLDFVTARVQFGRTLDRFQMVQERIADMTVELFASRALVHRCARRRDLGVETDGDLAMAKLYATEAAARACDHAVMLHGGRGYSTAYPVERLLRDVMGLRIYEGTTLIQKGLVARAITASRTRR
ncbi:MAG: acyl-CoA dehydrogenase family protein [Planctomycetes bacterium]|nr:acyl-CoA dehydrogenase family protein [Planctomycetota bacterium]